MSDVREVAEACTPNLECPTCQYLHDTEIALMWCCNEDEERRRGIYRGLD